MKIVTPRLELVPLTLEMITADLHRRDDLARLLDAAIGPGWPPLLYDRSAMEWTKRGLVSDPMLGGWGASYWILREPRTLIGLGGFKSRPRNGRVELGYGVLPLYQRRGFATEATNAMMNWAFANGAETVFAETLPELIASQGVLRKLAFKYVGEGSEPGVIRFERKRSRIAV